MNSFYGNIVNTGSSPFYFDKIYSNKFEMDSHTGDDGVFVGRYVLVSYDKTYSHSNFRPAFRSGSYSANDSNIKLYKDNTYQYPIKIQSDNRGEEETAIVGDIFYIIDGNIYVYYQCTGVEPDTNDALFTFYKELNHPWKEAFKKPDVFTTYNTLYIDKDCTQPICRKEDELDDSGVDNGDIVYVRDTEREESDKEKLKGWYSYYQCVGFEQEKATFIKIEEMLGHAVEGTLENYTINQQIDYRHYGQSYNSNFDKTVWQKVYVGSIEKYEKVANLNAETPMLRLSLDAPTENPASPYFEAPEVANGNVVDFHIQPTWGFRVAAANKALSKNGMYQNLETGSFETYLEKINNQIENYITEILGREETYQSEKQSSQNGLNTTISGLTEILRVYLEDNPDIVEGLTSYDQRINTYLNAMLENVGNFVSDFSYPTEGEDDLGYVFDQEGHAVHLTYRRPYTLLFRRDLIEPEIGGVSTLYQTILGDELWNILPKTITENNEEIPDYSPLAEQLSSLVNGVFELASYTRNNNILFNNNCGNILWTYRNNIGGILNNQYSQTGNENYALNALENQFDEIVLLEQAYFNEQSPYNDNETKNSLLEDAKASIQSVIFNDIQSHILEAVLKSDEKVQWKAQNKDTNYYYDGLTQKWTTDSNAKVDADIYYNKAGFNKEIRSYDSNDDLQDANYISISPTGYSQELYDGEWVNKSYNDQDSEYLGTTKEAPDTQELSIHLPAIGNAVSELWDIVYGTGELDETDNKVKRKTNISWNLDDAEHINSRIRFAGATENNGYDYNTDGLETVAGVINSTQDLMGRIIIENVTDDTDEENIIVYTNASDVPSNFVRDNVDKNRIYYFTNNEAYFRVADKIDFRDDFIPAEDYALKKNDLCRQDGSAAPDTWNPELTYYKKNPNGSVGDKVLIYRYIDTKEEYEQYVQGYVEAQNLVSSTNVPQNLYYKNEERGTYIYDKKYQKGESYFTLAVTPSPFAAAANEYRLDAYQNLINDSEYKWKGQPYYNLGDVLKGPYYLFQPQKFYINRGTASQPIWDVNSTRVFDEGQTYYKVERNTTSSAVIIDSEGNQTTVVTGQPPRYEKIYDPNDPSCQKLIDPSDKLVYFPNAEAKNYSNSDFEIIFADIDSDDINEGGFRRVVSYSDNSIEDDYSELPKFYVIDNNFFTSENPNLQDYEQEKYVPGKYYYSFGDSEPYSYQLDTSETGSSSRTYFKIKETYQEPKFYQPRTKYYLKKTTDFGTDIYYLSDKDLEENKTYYEHSEYYVTQDYDQYKIGQIWDYTLPWTKYSLDYGKERDKTNYASIYNQSVNTPDAQQEVVLREYFFDDRGKLPVEWAEDFVVPNNNTYYYLNSSNNFVLASSGQTVEDHFRYYIKLTNQQSLFDAGIDDDAFKFTGSDGKTYSIKRKEVSSANENTITNGNKYYYYFNITGYEDDQGGVYTPGFDIESLPPVFFKNNEFYIEKVLGRWQPGKYYYENDYAESIKQCKLIPSTQLEDYRKYYFEELKGFARSYNTINGLILQFNKALGVKDEQTRDLNTVYGAINRLNDEIRRLKIYDFSTINNIVGSIEYSFKTIKAIHDSLKGIQDQTDNTFNYLLTEFEAADSYVNIQDINAILGINLLEYDRPELNKTFKMRPDGGSEAEWPIAKDSNQEPLTWEDEYGTEHNYYWHNTTPSAETPTYEKAKISSNAQGVSVLSPITTTVGNTTKLNNSVKLFGENPLSGKTDNNIIQEILSTETQLKAIQDDYLKASEFNAQFAASIGIEPGTKLYNIKTIKDKIDELSLSLADCNYKLDNLENKIDSLLLAVYGSMGGLNGEGEIRKGHELGNEYGLLVRMGATEEVLSYEYDVYTNLKQNKTDATEEEIEGMEEYIKEIKAESEVRELSGSDAVKKMIQSAIDAINVNRGDNDEEKPDGKNDPGNSDGAGEGEENTGSITQNFPIFTKEELEGKIQVDGQNVTFGCYYLQQTIEADVSNAIGVYTLGSNIPQDWTFYTSLDNEDEITLEEWSEGFENINLDSLYVTFDNDPINEYGKYKVVYADIVPFSIENNIMVNYIPISYEPNRTFKPTEREEKPTIEWDSDKKVYYGYYLIEVIDHEEPDVDVIHYEIGRVPLRNGSSGESCQFINKLTQPILNTDWESKTVIERPKYISFNENSYSTEENAINEVYGIIYGTKNDEKEFSNNTIQTVNYIPISWTSSSVLLKYKKDSVSPEVLPGNDNGTNIDPIYVEYTTSPDAPPEYQASFEGSIMKEAITSEGLNQYFKYDFSKMKIIIVPKKTIKAIKPNQAIEIGIPKGENITRIKPYTDMAINTNNLEGISGYCIFATDEKIKFVHTEDLIQGEVYTFNLIDTLRDIEDSPSNIASTFDRIKIKTAMNPLDPAQKQGFSQEAYYPINKADALDFSDLPDIPKDYKPAGLDFNYWTLFIPNVHTKKSINNEGGFITGDNLKITKNTQLYINGEEYKTLIKGLNNGGYLVPVYKNSKTEEDVKKYPLFFKSSFGDDTKNSLLGKQGEHMAITENTKIKTVVDKSGEKTSGYKIGVFREKTGTNKKYHYYIGFSNSDNYSKKNNTLKKYLTGTDKRIDNDDNIQDKKIIQKNIDIDEILGIFGYDAYSFTNNNSLSQKIKKVYPTES